MKCKKHILIILLILTSGFAFAQVTFKTKVSKKKIGINERLRVEFVMNQDGDNFKAPSFEGFSGNGPSQSINNSWVNGVRTYSKTYTYVLTPKRKGRLVIKQATIEIEGEIYKTQPIAVEVTSAVDKPNDPNNIDFSEKVHLVTEISSTRPYLNEPITVVHKLYVAPDISLSNISEIDAPGFNDFWSQKIDIGGLRAQNGSYKGEDYRYVVLSKMVLYPQKTGKLKIEPLTINATIEVPTNKRSFFGRIMTRVDKSLSSKSRTINVKSFPESGKPVDFNGAVGEFSFKVTPSKTELKASESFQVKVEVSGKGNLKLFTLPKLSLPSSLEVYEPEHKESVKTNGQGMRGSISDNYTIVPQYKGKYPIPSISFSYFDLKTKKYKQLSSNEIIIDVLDGPLNNSNSSNNNAVVNNMKQQVVLNGDQFSYIKTTADLKPTKTEYFFKSKLFWTLLLSPLLSIPLGIFIRKKSAKRNADVFGNKVRKADKLAKKYLGDAKKALGQKEAFYIALERALHNYLKAKLHIETSEFSKENIKELLANKQVEEGSISDFIDLLQSCELARYTPATSVEMQKDFDKAAQTISSIDKQIR